MTMEPGIRSCDVEPLGILKNFRIPVSRGVRKIYLFTFPDLAITDRGA